MNPSRRRGWRKRRGEETRAAPSPRHEAKTQDPKHKTEPRESHSESPGKLELGSSTADLERATRSKTEREAVRADLCARPIQDELLQQ